MSELKRLKTVDEVRAIGRSLKKNSQSALQNDLKRFLQAGFSLRCSPDSVCRYLTESAQGLHGRGALKPESLTRFLSSLRKAYTQNERLRHLTCPADTPEVTETMKGLYQLYSHAPKQAKALTMAQLVTLCEELKRESETVSLARPQRLLAARDRALIACAFWRGLRADTLGSIRMQDVAFADHTLRLTLPREKQRRSMGMTVAEYEPGWLMAPVDAMRDWLTLYHDKHTQLPAPEWDEENHVKPAVLFPRVLRKAGIRSRSDELDRHAITGMLRKRLPMIGIHEVAGYSAHSFRHSLGSWGGMYLPADVLMNLGGWAKLESVQHYLKKNRLLVSLEAANQQEKGRLIASTQVS